MSETKGTNLLGLPPHEPIPGFTGQFFHTDEITVARWHVQKGSLLPEHQHHNRQVVHMIEGRFAMTIGESKHVFEAGDIIEIPAGTPHSGEALEACTIYDIFIPVREAYRF